MKGITPQIDEMEKILEEGRRAKREGKSLRANPYDGLTAKRGYWRLGWFQERDKEE